MSVSILATSLADIEARVASVRVFVCVCVCVFVCLSACVLVFLIEVTTACVRTPAALCYSGHIAITSRSQRRITFRSNYDGRRSCLLLHCSSTVLGYHKVVFACLRACVLVCLCACVFVCLCACALVHVCLCVLVSWCSVTSCCSSSHD